MTDDRSNARPDNARTDSAKLHDDSDIINAAAEDGVGGDGGVALSSGGNRQLELGSRDEMKRATDPDAGITGVEKSTRIQPGTRTRSDNEGANG